MRIAFAMINCNRRDGSARAVNEVAERLSRRGHDVHLFARKAEDLDLTAVRWHPVPGPSWPEVVDFWSYHALSNRKLRRSHFDIVHSIGPNTACANVVTIQNIQPAKWQILQRHAAKENVSLPRRLSRWLYLHTTSLAEKQLYTATPAHRPPLFLPVSHGVEAELRAHYAIGDAPVRIIPNAADVSVFRPRTESERLAWRAKNGFEAENVICIFSGGEWARKGLDLAIGAMEKISDPRVKLFVAGDDADRDRFKALAASHNVASRIVFGGFRSDIAMAMAASDIFLFPSHYEAFSLATIEAAACGLPVIASKINGTEDFIRPGVNGEFIAHDPGHIASVLAPFLSNPQACKTMGLQARQIVERDYTWDRVTALTEEAYQSILPL